MIPDVRSISAKASAVESAFRMGTIFATGLPRRVTITGLRLRITLPRLRRSSFSGMLPIDITSSVHLADPHGTASGRATQADSSVPVPPRGRDDRKERTHAVYEGTPRDPRMHHGSSELEKQIRANGAAPAK